MDWWYVTGRQVYVYVVMGFRLLARRARQVRGVVKAYELEKKKKKERKKHYHQERLDPAHRAVHTLRKGQ